MIVRGFVVIDSRRSLARPGDLNKLSADTGMPTTTRSTTSRAKALGDFLKRTRSNRTPDATARATPRRRAKGMRREEAALAAGISLTWYTWIEQGRPVSCSRATLDRIARALRMDRTERSHLFDLAHDVTATPARALLTRAPAELAALVDDLRESPAYVINALWDVLHFNAACGAVLGPFERGARVSGNVLRRLFLDDAWRTGFEDWEATAQSAVAQFRAATGRLQGGDALATLVSALADESAEFRAMWERRRLAAPPLRHKVFRHPTAGRLTLHYATMKPDAADYVSVVLYVPVAESFDAVRSLV